MPKIPDYTQLRRDIPQVSGDIDTRGVGANVGGGLIDVAGVTNEIHQNKMNEEVAIADAELYKHIIDTSRAFDEDDDFETMRQRFDGDVSGKLGEVAAKITDPNRRAKFVNNYKKDIASHGDRVSGKAWNKKVDFKKAELMTNLDNYRDSALRDDDPEALGKANMRYTNAIKSARGLNYITEAEGTALLKNMRDDTAKAHVNMLPVEKRMGALKQLKNQLPPDQYIALKNATEEELRIGKAQTQVDEFMDQGIDRKEVMTKIDKKYSKDPELRADIEQRYDYAKNKQDRARVEEQGELFDTYFLPVRMGESTVNDIPREDLERMSPSQQNSLMSAQSSSVAKSKAPFNLRAEDKLNQLYLTKKFPELRQYYVENAGSMNETQQKQWSKISIDGVTPENKSLFTVSQTINNKAPGYSKERKARLNEAVAEWYMDKQEKDGFAPSDEERDKQIDAMLMEHDTSWWWGGTEPAFEMDDEQKAEAIKLAKEDDPQAFEDITQYFLDNGINANHTQFMQAYQTLKDQRSAK